MTSPAIPRPTPPTRRWPCVWSGDASPTYTILKVKQRAVRFLCNRGFPPPVALSIIAQAQLRSQETPNMSYAIAILGISVLIALHELGHFAMARACGMRVNVFSLGFGPVLLSHKRGETSYQLAAIPLGGFVQIEGMGGASPTKSPQPPGPAQLPQQAPMAARLGGIWWPHGQLAHLCQLVDLFGGKLRPPQARDRASHARRARPHGRRPYRRPARGRPRPAHRRAERP